MRQSTVKELLFCLLLVVPLSLTAQEEGGGEEEEKPKTIAELTEDATKVEGLFTLFRDPKAGETSMLVKKDQLDKEFIYFIHIENGLVDAGYFKGAYGPSFIFTIQRRFDKLEVVRENTAFYFDPDNAISRAAEANISDAVLAVEAIVAEDEDTGDILIKADKLFMSEAFIQLSPTPNPDADPRSTFAAGKIDGEKSKIVNLRSYPMNTDVEVEYVFHNPTPMVFGSAAVTDARNTSLRVLHSLIEVPDNDYQPRFADPRIGSFDQQVTDLTSTESAPYRDVINRWHLVKKDPSAALSEPVEPITWWIENTTPVEWRDLIKNAALEWNKSFEKAGFKNALVVKVQPDDADWDAGDIRYNVLRWTSSPLPPFGGYGPSFANPRTGQLIGADIMLEYSFLARATLARKLIQGDTLAAPTHMHSHFADHYCALGHSLALNGMFADLAFDVSGMSPAMTEQLTRDEMHYLILHEIGHTLGMNHNMKATQLLSPEQAFDKDAVANGILAGSVMDYPALNFAASEEEQTLFYSIAAGPYDDWYIEYAYSPGLDDADAEASRLEAIASRSNDPQLVFGNDADDMRSPGSAMDPRVNIYDMSSDSITYAGKQMDLMLSTLDKMASWSPESGQSYQDVLEGVEIMVRLWGIHAGVVSRWVGGVYVDRSVVGQDGATEPFRPVEKGKQKQAMQVLSEKMFAPDAFAMDAALLRKTAPERRGFNHFGSTEDPKVHDAVLASQKAVLDHLLNPVVLKRITDTQLYGNGYSLAEMMGDLTDAMFAADARGNVNSFRQNLQMEYVVRLAGMSTGAGAAAYHTPAQSMAMYQLTEIQDLLSSRRGGNTATKAHTQHLLFAIEKALSVEG
ncbi:MAG: zinc-dependent metalloprotease [Pseudomonadota bacterium]